MDNDNKILAGGTIQPHLSKEVRDERNNIFDKEMFDIAEKYSKMGYQFDRKIDLPVHHNMGDESVLMFEFPEDLNIPMDMQKEIAKSWSKLWIP